MHNIRISQAKPKSLGSKNKLKLGFFTIRSLFCCHSGKKDTEISLFEMKFHYTIIQGREGGLFLFHFGNTKFEITVDKSLIWLDLEW